MNTIVVIELKTQKNTENLKMTTGQNIGYIRVSTVDQNLDRQLDGLSLDKVFEDKVSGRTKDRPGLQQMISHIREGDTVYCHDISRMARNLKDLLSLVDEITAKGATLRFEKENLTFTGDKSNPMEQLMLNLLGSVYQFEVSMMKERQKEGIAIAKAAGKFKGRPASVDTDRILELLESGMSMRKVATETGTSLSTVQRTKKAAQIDC